MRRIFWDTNLFIYLIEDHGSLSERTIALRRGMGADDQLYTSALTLGEILVKPTESNREDIGRQYEEIITQAATVIPFNRTAARAYAQVRIDRTIKPPDAVQLACAVVAEIDLFVTNDARLSKKIIPGVRFIAALEVAGQLV